MTLEAFILNRAEKCATIREVAGAKPETPLRDVISVFKVIEEVGNIVKEKRAEAKK